MSEDPVLTWLLEEDNPPVRLLTLTRLLQIPDSEKVVQDAKNQLMTYSVTQNILEHIDEIWQSGPRTFWSFKGKHWNTVYLGHFMADGHDPRIARGVEAHLSHPWVSEKFQCMTASMLTAFRRLGYGSCPVVMEGTEILAQRLLEQGGVSCMGMNYDLMTHCYMTLPKQLFCFSEVPSAKRSVSIQAAIDWIVSELVSHQVYVYIPGNSKIWNEIRDHAPKRADLPGGKSVKEWLIERRALFIEEQGPGELQPKKYWTKFGFPLSYNSDILEAMLALVSAGTPMTKDLEKPLQVILDKRTSDGVWLMDNSLNGKMWADVEVKGQPSKWITLFALIVLHHFGIHGICQS